MNQYEGSRRGRDALTSARERNLASAVRKVGSSIYSHVVERAFEEAGCTCAPYRERLNELEVEYKSAEKRLQDEYAQGRNALEDSELGQEVKELRLKIREIDQEEHPSLDQQGRRAYHFLPVWLLDQVREGNYDILEASSEDISKTYADAWIGGWRPRSLKEEQAAPESK